MDEEKGALRERDPRERENIRPKEDEDKVSSTSTKWQGRRRKRKQSHSHISKHRHAVHNTSSLFASLWRSIGFLMMCIIMGGRMTPGVVEAFSSNHDPNNHAIIRNMAGEDNPMFAIAVVGRVFTTEECYVPLTRNDADGDAEMDVAEYLTWVQELSGNFFSASTQYFQLPLALKVNFVALSCGCDFVNINCCDAADDYYSRDKSTLDIEGTTPGSTVSEDQAAYLFEICSRTMDVIDSLLPPPTMPPTSSPTTSSPTTTTLSPTTTTTLSPSISPTTEEVGLPTFSLFTGDVDVSVEFSVNLGRFTLEQVVAALDNTVRSDLQAAFRLLVLEVVRETFSSLSVRQRQRQLRQLQRFLTVATQEGASRVNTLTPIDCNGDGNCAVVKSTTILSLVEENRDTVEDKYRTAILEAIKAGRLNFLLNQVNPDSDIITIDGPTDPAGGGGDGGGGIALGGIIAGAVGFVLLMSVVALYVSKRHNARKSAYLESEWTTGSQQAPTSSRGFVPLGDSSGEEDDDGSAPGLMGATPLAALAEEDDADFVNNDLFIDTRSSDAGSSGWSSSAGISSLATSRTSDQTSLGTFGETAGGSPGSNGAGSTLSTDLEAASGGIVEQMRNHQGIQFIPVDEDDLGLNDGNSTIESDQIHNDNAEDVGSPATKKATQKDLESAIQAGDWAAVGATAAVLAAAGEGSSKSSSFRSIGDSTISTAKGSRDVSISKEEDAQVRAKDLDHLVDAGDWEGVVIVAASQFQDGSNGDGSGKLTDSQGDISSGNNSGDVSGKASNKSPNSALETNEASASHSAGGSGGGGVGAAAAVGAAGALGIGAAAMATRRRRKNKEEDEDSMSGNSLVSGTSSSSSEISLAMRKRTALELAIEAGDWDKVGEAAAELDDSSSNGSVMTHSTPSSARRRLAAVKDPRASELDKMIDNKDWQGVVAAAGRFHELEGSSQGSQPGPPHPPGGEEEAAAQKQAEVWMAIAAKTQHSDTDGEGARAAADWAIARSLSALQRAERKGQLTEGDVISIMSSKSWASSGASTSGSSNSDDSTQIGEQSI
eukprot:scaffold215519_cov53-Attheya_sp.AAC.2